jgi:putative NADH-flavin reductase
MQAMLEAKLDRLIYIGGMGILAQSAEAKAPPKMESAKFPEFMKPISALHWAAYQVAVAASAKGIKYTVIAPPTILKAQQGVARTDKGKYKHGAEVAVTGVKNEVNAEYIAQLMVEEITANAYINKRVSIANVAEANAASATAKK